MLGDQSLEELAGAGDLGGLDLDNCCTKRATPPGVDRCRRSRRGPWSVVGSPRHVSASGRTRFSSGRSASETLIRSVTRDQGPAQRDRRVRENPTAFEPDPGACGQLVAGYPGIDQRELNVLGKARQRHETVPKPSALSHSGWADRRRVVRDDDCTAQRQLTGVNTPPPPAKASPIRRGVVIAQAIIIRGRVGTTSRGKTIRAGLAFRDRERVQRLSASLAIRSPPRLSRCRLVLPEEAGRIAPARPAEGRLADRRSGLSPAATNRD